MRHRRPVHPRQGPAHGHLRRLRRRQVDAHGPGDPRHDRRCDRRLPRRRAGPHRVKAERLKGLCRWFINAGGFGGIEAMSTAKLCSDLRAIRGIGPETADVIALYAADRPRFIADAYAFRIFERLGWWQGNTRRYETLREQVEAAAPEHWRAAEYDEIHALVVRHAIALCHKRHPDCANCPLAERCAQIGVTDT